MQEKVTLKKVSKQKKHCKKAALAFIMANVLVFSSSLAFASDNTSALESFKAAFGDKAKYLKNSAVQLQASDTQQGVTLNALASAADEKTVHILFEVAKEDKTAFKGNYLMFENVIFKVDGRDYSGRNKTLEEWNKGLSTRTFNMINMGDKPSDKYIMQLSMQDHENLLTGKGTLTATNIMLYDLKTWTSNFDLVKLFKGSEVLISQAGRPNKEPAAYNEKWQQIKAGGEKVKAAEIPKKLLPSQKLEIALYPEVPNWKVDNIGFVDQKLHIKMHGDSKVVYTPQLVDSKGNSIKMIYNSVYHDNNTADAYYIFDVKNIEQLSKLKLQARFRKEIEKIKGEWNLKVNIKVQDFEKILDRSAALTINKKPYTLNQVKLTNLSMILSMTGAGKAERIQTDVKIFFKNGAEVQLVSGTLSAYINHGNGTLETIHQFREPIDYNEVSYIVFNGTKVVIN